MGGEGWSRQVVGGETEQGRVVGGKNERWEMSGEVAGGGRQN